MELPSLDSEVINGIRWFSANAIIEQQTKQIAKEFKTSRPKPRNRAMGFRGAGERREMAYGWR